MCTTCGCDHEQHHHHDHHHRHDDLGDAGREKTVAIGSDILAKNNRFATRNREALLSSGVLAINMVSSPGSGKTSILERTLLDLAGRFRCAVIEGDQQTDHDAVRIAATGVPVEQINTGSGCHLDAHMIGHAMGKFNLSVLDLLLIENVGNLVCPAAFDLGEKHKVVVLSVTEGEDKPLKYPHMFRAADVMLLNKIDLLPHVEFEVDRCRDFARRVNPEMIIFEISSRTGEGMSDWYSWLAEPHRGGVEG